MPLTDATPGAGRPERASTARGSSGRPKVKLDRLSFPSIENGSYYKKHLERSLRRAVRDADWGAGSGSVIEYRFRVTRLELEHDAGVVRATCAATGELPGGVSASSEIRFGDAPAQRRELIKRVLSVVARGVVTRLAEIEHRRRQGS
jgi:hypothetical protein